MNPDQMRRVVNEVLDKAPFSLRDLATEAGVSYDSMRSWATARRHPRPKKLAALSAALRKRGLQLIEYADALDQAARPSS